MHGRFGLAALVVTGVFAACSGAERPHSSLGDSHAQEVVLAAARTVRAGTGRFRMTIAANSAGGQQSLAAQGAFDTDRRRLSLTVDVPPFPGLTIATERVEILAVEGVLYVRSPSLAQLLGVPTGWIGVRDSGRALTDLQLVDPAGLLARLEQLDGRVTPAGTEDVGGFSTTHLVGQLDGVPVDVFVDDAGLVRRIRMGFDAAREQGGVLVSSDYFDVGASVTIDPPPADDVTDETDALTRLFGGTTGG